MKATLLASIVVLMTGITSKAQELVLDSTSQKLMYRMIVRVDSASAGELYERARQWVAMQYVSANDVIQYQSKEEGKIIARGLWADYKSIGYLLWHTLIIDVKPGRARITFTEFFVERTDPALASNVPLENVRFMKKAYKGDCYQKSDQSSQSLEKALKAAILKNDGW